MRDEQRARVLPGEHDRGDFCERVQITRAASNRREIAASAVADRRKPNHKGSLIAYI